MAERPRLLPLAAAVALLTLSPASYAQWRVTPMLDLRETYTDNVTLREESEATNQFVTEVRSALKVNGKTARTEVVASAELSKYFYSNDDEQQNLNDSLRNYSAIMKNTLADQLLYLDVGATSRRQSISAFGPGAEENPFSRANQTNVKTWNISPYLMHRFSGDTTAMLRYSRDSVEADNNAYGTSLGDTVSLNLSSGLGRRALSWGFDIIDQKLDNELVGESSSRMVNASLRYQFTRTWAATASAGHSRYDFEGPGSDESGRTWNLGFAWTPSQRTSLNAAIGRHLYGNTATLAALYRSRSSVWEIRYDDTITSNRSQFLLPASIDTASMIDRLLSASILDPVARQRAVQAYILSNGLPASMANDINYLSNRYARQKLLSASVAFNRARSTGVASLYYSERIALSDQQSDSPLLGTQFGSLNDNVRQHGASLYYTYRLNGRANAFARADYRFSRSLTTSFEDRQRMLSVGVDRRLGRSLKASAELRRRSGGTDIVGRRDYTENALAASLNMQF